MIVVRSLKSIAAHLKMSLGHIKRLAMAAKRQPFTFKGYRFWPFNRGWAVVKENEQIVFLDEKN
jgi:hypothetical protein